MQRRRLLLSPAALVAAALPGGGRAQQPPAPPSAFGPEGWQAQAEGGFLVVRQELRQRARIAVTSLDGKRHGEVLALLFSPARRALLAATSLPELWELSLDPEAPPVLDGFVHDFRSGEALPSPGFLHPRRTPLAEPLTALMATAHPAHVVGSLPAARDGTPRIAWANLDVRRVLHVLAVDGSGPRLTTR